MRCLSECKKSSVCSAVSEEFYADLNDKSDQMEKLERERAWREEEFDFVLQFLRTVLLKRE